MTAARMVEIWRMRVELLAVWLPKIQGISPRSRSMAFLRLARTAMDPGERDRAAEFNRMARRIDPVRASLVLLGRSMLGTQRAGAVRQWWRQRSGRPAA